MALSSVYVACVPRSRISDTIDQLDSWFESGLRPVLEGETPGGRGVAFRGALHVPTSPPVSYGGEAGATRCFNTLAVVVIAGESNRCFKRRGVVHVLPFHDPIDSIANNERVCAVLIECDTQSSRWVELESKGVDVGFVLDMVKTAAGKGEEMPLSSRRWRSLEYGDTQVLLPILETYPLGMSLSEVCDACKVAAPRLAVLTGQRYRCLQCVSEADHRPDEIVGVVPTLARPAVAEAFLDANGLTAGHHVVYAARWDRGSCHVSTLNLAAAYAGKNSSLLKSVRSQLALQADIPPLEWGVNAFMTLSRR